MKKIILTSVGILALTAAFSTATAALITDPGTGLTLGDGSGITYDLTGNIVGSTGDDLRFSTDVGGSFTMTFDSAVDLTIYNSANQTSVNFDDDKGVNSGVITANAGSWAYTAGAYDLTSATQAATLGDSALSGLDTSVLTISTTRGFFPGSDAGIAASGAVRSNADWGELSISGVTSVTYVFSNATNYDSMRIDAVAVPEPATLGLVAAFGGAVLFIRRRFMM